MRETNESDKNNSKINCYCKKAQLIYIYESEKIVYYTVAFTIVSLSLKPLIIYTIGLKFSNVYLISKLQIGIKMN